MTSTSAPDSNASLAPIPDGFRAGVIGGPFVAQNGPFYGRWLDGRFQMGLRIEHRHCNPIGMCHGGMLATFADMLLPCIAVYQAMSERRFLPTVNLQVDYLAGVPEGAWLQGDGEVLRVTRNLVFVQAVATVDGSAALRMSGVFKQGPVLEGRANADPFGVRT